jgi:hypothetical protein
VGGPEVIIVSILFSIMYFLNKKQRVTHKKIGHKQVSRIKEIVYPQRIAFSGLNNS